MGIGRAGRGLRVMRMGWRQTLAALAAAGIVGAGLVGTAYVVAPGEMREAASEMVTVVQELSGGRAQEVVEDAGEVTEGAAEGQGIGELTSLTGLPDWIQQTYIDGADLVYDDMFGGQGGPARVRLYERDVRWDDDVNSALREWWLVLLVDRPDGTQIFYQDWERDGDLNAVAFTQDGETRFYEGDIIRVFREGNEEDIWEYGIGDPLFEEGNPQLEAYLSTIYAMIGTYEERHAEPDALSPPLVLQQEDLGILRGER